MIILMMLNSTHLAMVFKKQNCVTFFQIGNKNDYFNDAEYYSFSIGI